MTPIELKQYIFNNDKIKLILENIECHHIKETMNYYSCGNCNGDNPNAIIVYKSEYLKTVNYTRSKEFDELSDIITLVQYNRGVLHNDNTFVGAIKYIHDLLNIQYCGVKIKKKTNEFNPLSIFEKHAKKESVNDFILTPLDEELSEMYIPTVHIDWFREGIVGKTIDKFELGYSFKFKRNVIPLRYWLTGDLMGFNKRTVIENYNELGIKKYMITPSYNKSHNLYGLFQNINEIETKKYITIFEAEKSVLKRDSRGDGTCVALQGHVISDEQVRIILGLDINEIVIALDKDVEINEIRHMCERFYGIRKVSYIYDSYDLLKDKDSPADIKNDLYEFLFMFRITYDADEHEKYLKYMSDK